MTYAENEAGRLIPLERATDGGYVIGPPRTVSTASRALRIAGNERDAIVSQEVFNRRRFASHSETCRKAPEWQRKEDKS